MIYDTCLVEAKCAPNKFSAAVTRAASIYQQQGLTVEVQYAPCPYGTMGIHYTALVIARKDAE
jgi:hypothetical protein